MTGRGWDQGKTQSHSALIDLRPLPWVRTAKQNT
jgi:hypothetical protein